MEESGERTAVVSNTRLAGRSSSDAALSLITYILQPTTHLNTSWLSAYLLASDFIQCYLTA
jgi:hypothetical protein